MEILPQACSRYVADKIYRRNAEFGKKSIFQGSLTLVFLDDLI